MTIEILLSGAVGALAVYVLGVVGKVLQRRQELRAKMLLLTPEIRRNQLTVNGLLENPTELLNETPSTLIMQDWDSVKVRLAELMPVEDFQQVSYYYLFLHELRDMKINRKDIFQDVAPSGLEKANIQGVLALEVTEEYSGLIVWWPDEIRIIRNILKSKREDR